MVLFLALVYINISSAFLLRVHIHFFFILINARITNLMQFLKKFKLING